MLVPEAQDTHRQPHRNGRAPHAPHGPLTPAMRAEAPALVPPAIAHPPRPGALLPPAEASHALPFAPLHAGLAWCQRWADPLALLGCVVVVAFFFWQIWTPNVADRVAFPIGNFTHHTYPLRRFVAGALAEGQLPLWNPWIFGGQPGLADPQAAALYPPAMLNALLWGADYPLLAIELEVMAHILLAVWGSYAFLRLALRLAPLPSLMGATVFALGGPLVGLALTQVPMVESAAWLPWLLLATHNATMRGDLWVQVRGAAGMALCVGLALLAGHVPMALALGALSLAYLLLRVGRPQGVWPWVAQAGPGLLAFPVGVALGAAQLLPMQAFIEVASRSSLSAEFDRSDLTWQTWATVVLPQLDGSSPLFLGVGALLLAGVGLLTGPQRQQRFWLAMGVGSLALALVGNPLPFAPTFFGVPVLASAPGQGHMLVLVGWVVAVGAAWGLSRLQQMVTSSPGSPQDAGPTGGDATRQRLERGLMWLGGLFPLLILPLVGFWWLQALIIAGYSGGAASLAPFYGGYLFWVVMVAAYGLLSWWGLAQVGGMPYQRLLFGGMLVGLLWFELFSVNQANHLGLVASETLVVPEPMVSTLQQALAEQPARVAVLGEPWINGNDGMRWGLPMLTGNGPLRLTTSKDFLNKIEPWRQFQLLRVGYVIADKDLAAESPQVYAPLAQLRDNYVVKLRQPAPLAWLVGEVEVWEGDSDEIRERLNDPAFDPLRAVLYDESRPVAGYPVSGTVQVEVYRPGFVRLHTQAPADMILVLAEPYLKSWRASIDGTSAKVRRGNLVNVTLSVPAGTHQVELWYEQEGWERGQQLAGGALLIILISAVGSLGATLRGTWRRRARGETGHAGASPEEDGEGGVG